MICNIYYVDGNLTTRDQRWDASEGKLLPRKCFRWVHDMVVENLRIEDTRDHLDELFERFNIGDHGGKDIRSMSVGDVVEYTTDGGKLLSTWICASFGWNEII